MATLAELLGRSPISIQKVTVSGNPYEYTIAAVNPATTAVFVGGVWKNSSTSSGSHAAFLTNSTTLKVYHSGISGTDFDRDVYVVDFGPMVKSVQSMLVSLSSSFSASISAVNPNKCIVIIDLNRYTSGTLNKCTHTLTANSISISTNQATTINSNVQIIEFY